MAVVAERDESGGSRVLSRSSTKPIFVALGTATVLTLSPVALPATALAADLGPAAGDDPSADPSDPPPESDSPPDTPTPDTPTPDTPPPDTPPPDTPPPDTPPPDSPGSPGSSPPYHPSPVLNLRLTLSAGAATPGGSVTATARVSAQRAVAHHAVLRLSASSANVSGPVSLGDLSGARSVSGVVRIPAGHALLAGTGTITVTASLSADKASTHIATGKINVTSTVDETAKGAEIGGEMPPSPSLPVPGLPGTAAAVGGPAQAQLPMIAQEPSVASGELPAVRPVSLRTKASPLGLDPTAYRLFWTQVAWLATLLVAVSLLLTQLRLNRRRVPVVTGGSRRRTPGGGPSVRR
jgi:hypothetical protein